MRQDARPVSYTITMKRLILGLAGNPGSGKTALAKYLEERYGFYHFEGSTGIREAAEKMGVALKSREDYSNFHTRLQKEFGKDVLAKTLLARQEDRVVFAGLRSPHNAQALQEAGGLIIGLACPLDVCFSRQSKETDFEAFRQTVESERHSQDGYGANLQPVLDMADITLDTSQPLEACYRHIDDKVAKMLRGKLPS